MKDSTFTIDQITALREIERARMRSGLPGLRQDIQVLISRLTSGGVGPKAEVPERVRHAKQLWDCGWGSELGYESFDDYLLTIPEIPEFPASYSVRFPLLVLVDARPGLDGVCRILYVEVPHAREGAITVSHSFRESRLYWMRAQDNSADAARALNEDELCLTACEGLALCVQYRRLRTMRLAGSVPCDIPNASLYLQDTGKKFILYRHARGAETGKYGIATRGK